MLGIYKSYNHVQIYPERKSVAELCKTLFLKFLAIPIFCFSCAIFLFNHFCQWGFLHIFLVHFAMLSMRELCNDSV